MKVAKVAFFILTLLGLVSTGCVKDEPDAWSLGPGDSVPDFTVTLHDGSSWSSTSMRGRGAVLVFFNTGCADCRRELPQVQAAYEECAAKGMPVDFICIAREQTAADISGWWDSHGLTMPYSPQLDRALYNLFAAVGIPRIYVVGPRGVIISAYGPDSAPDSAILLDAIRSSLSMTGDI